MTEVADLTSWKGKDTYPHFQKPGRLSILPTGDTVALSSQEGILSCILSPCH